MMGVNQRAINIQKATVRPTRPVLPPSLIPVADSAHEQRTISILALARPREFSEMHWLLRAHSYLICT